MAGKRIELISSAYDGKSIIASGQERVNLYAEINSRDPQAPAKVTEYPTPGTELYCTPPIGADNSRGCYRTSLGTAFYVVGPSVYFVSSTGVLIFIGAIADRESQISFSDNGIVCVLVDGINGYVIDLATNNIGIITDPNFYGADYVTLLDTFFIFNVPDTNQWYISVSNASYILLTTVGAFDPLDIASKSGFNDPIVGIVAVHGELWLIGALTTEIWIGTGAADFYFQRQQGAYINHGCGAQYSISTMDVLVFFIMQDQQGSGIIVQGQGYEVTEISTPRIVDLVKTWGFTDAIGFCFQVADHAFYALVFPTASKGLLYDLKTKQWSEWNWIDGNGTFLRPRVNCAMFVNGFNLGGDWENGKLLKLSPDLYTDEGTPIVRVRTFPHMNDDNAKVTYLNFQADIEPGTITDQEADPMISLSWSDDKGRTYGNPVMQSMGKTGEYLTVPSWNALGEARDRVFKLSWSIDMKTALNGGFIERKKARR
jgi:hypothetical protein